jgi:hypothetical protein
VNGGDPKSLAATSPIALAVKPLDHLLDAKGSRGAVAVEIELVDEPDAFGLYGVDVELFLDLGTAPLGLYEPVAERGCSAIPEPLSCILLHRTDDVLGVLSGLVFVEQRDHLAHHRMDRLAFVADRLCDRDHLDVMLRQFPKIELLLERLAEEAAVAVYDDHVERVLPIARTLDHLLENRPAIVRGGRAGLDELCGHRIAMNTTPGLQLLALIGNRQVMFGLPACRNAHVERGPRLGRPRFRSCLLFMRLHGRPLAFARLIFAAIGLCAKAL